MCTNRSKSKIAPVHCVIVTYIPERQYKKLLNPNASNIGRLWEGNKAPISLLCLSIKTLVDAHVYTKVQVASWQVRGYISTW